MKYTRHRKFVIWFSYISVLVALAGTKVEGALFAQDFDTDQTANWTVNDSGLSDIRAEFFYDYSQIGVPAAPGGTSTRGIVLSANNTGGVFSGFSVSPTGQSFLGDYELSFDMWQNYVGPLGPGGSGSTQLSTFGVLHSGTTAFWAGAATKNSVGFAATLDGGSATDYRAYSSLAPIAYASGDEVYSAPGGGNNNSNAYYTSHFPQTSAPAAQLGLFPGQTGSTDAGEASFRWAKVRIQKLDGKVTWTLDGLEIAEVDLAGLTLGGNNIFFGHSDTNAGSSTDPNDSLLNVTIIDNVLVEAIPEPSSMLLTALSAGMLLIRRRV